MSCGFCSLAGVLDGMFMPGMACMFCGFCSSADVPAGRAGAGEPDGIPIPGMLCGLAGGGDPDGISIPGISGIPCPTAGDMRPAARTQQAWK
jgi:hypothetical protein